MFKLLTTEKLHLSGISPPKYALYFNTEFCTLECSKIIRNITADPYDPHDLPLNYLPVVAMPDFQAMKSLTAFLCTYRKHVKCQP